MKNIIVQLVNRKILIEADQNFEGNSTRVLAYASIETEEGFMLKDISVRQDVNNPTDIRVVFPFRKVHDEIVPYIEFVNAKCKKEITLKILESLKDSMNGYINFRY